MFAKTFEKFSYTSAGISTFLLLGISYYYTTLDINWSLFESKIINGILIFGALMLSNYAIDTVTRQLTIERSNRNAYHLLLYPLIVMSYPVESIDMRFILSSENRNMARMNPIMHCKSKYCSFGQIRFYIFGSYIDLNTYISGFFSKMGTS